METQIYNERIKLAAGALDRLSTALATLGAITPFAAVIYGGLLSLGGQFAVISMICWLLGAISLHLFAQQLLGGLRYDSV